MTNIRLLGEALKFTRRRIYLHGVKWRVLVVSKTPAQTQAAYDEILRIMNASSMEVESSSLGANTFIQVHGGAMIRFATIRDGMDAAMWAGTTWAHVIFMYEPNHKIWETLRAQCRSTDEVIQKDLTVERVDW